MDAQFYVEITFLREVDGECRFQQDNGPKHTSRLAKAFIAENMPQVMDWPFDSPDLNPIENFTEYCQEKYRKAYVKKNVERRMSKNLTELERFIENGIIFQIWF